MDHIQAISTDDTQFQTGLGRHQQSEEKDVSLATPELTEFAQSWLSAWNRHDVEAVLQHFDEDIVFSSPVAKQLLKDSDGILHGKEALRQYWTEGLRRIPDLHFDLLAVYAGVNCIVLNYRNQKGGLVCEVLVFNGHRVIAGYGTYLDTNDNLAGASR